MKKIILCLIGLIFCMQSIAWANIHQSKVANVESIRSVFSYKDPEEVKIYEQKKLIKEQNNSDEKITEPNSIFRIFVSKDRFYSDKKYREKIDLAITSHNREYNFILDNEYSPYFILIDNQNKQEALHLSEVKYDNPYWISFKLSKAEIDKIVKAVEIKVVMPEAQENLFYFNEDKDKIEKKEYKKSMNIIEKTYDIPAEIVKEWKQVLTNEV